MKTILILLLSLSLTAAFSQTHFTIPVRELDTLTAMRDTVNAFALHPLQLDVDVQLLDFSTYTVVATTTFREDISHNPYYKAKNTQTTALLQLPMAVFDLPGAINTDKSYNVAKLNAILALFFLQVDTKRLPQNN